MQLTAHAPAQRGVDDLVLAHPGQAAKLLADDGRGVVVAIAGEVVDR